GRGDRVDAKAVCTGEYGRQTTATRGQRAERVADDPLHLRPEHDPEDPEARHAQEHTPADRDTGSMVLAHRAKLRARRAESGIGLTRAAGRPLEADLANSADRKSTRLNSSHLGISYA